MLSLARLAALANVSLSISCAGMAAQLYPNTSNFGVPFSEDEHWYQQCMRVADLGEPEMSSSRSAASRCNASELYYTKRNQAVASPAEWSKVRACAIANADNAVLMMLYANGFGVQRDTDIALHYACKLEFIAKSEMEHRVEHLVSAKRTEAPFDQCDDITSGYMGAICAGIREDQDKRVRDARMDSMSKKLTPAGRDAFARLRVVAERYAAEATGEVDMQGSGAAAEASQHQARLREQFTQAALDTFSGKLPPASPAAYTEQDTALNEAYQAVMAAASTQSDWPDRIGASTVSHTMVRNTERLWLAYRDAFVAFAATLPSAPTLDAVKTLLTSQRRAQLADLELYR
jgi:uncharacterized protein YecT (DUF1311 family)